MPRLLAALCCLLAATIAFAQPKPAAEPSFDVLEYVVHGNTVLSPAAIQRAVYPHLGRAKTIRDVESARAALEQAYRDAGYATVIVDIPVQKVDAGVVRLIATEGRVERTVVRGSRYYSQGRILESAPQPGEVPFFPELQKGLVALNRSADRRVTPVLRAGSLPATTEIELKVADQLPLHGNVELNNRQSVNTTSTRLNGALRYENLWQRDHAAGIVGQITPEDTDEVRVLFLTYSVPLDAGGSLYGYYVRSDSNVAALGALTVLGKGEIYGLRWGIPLEPVGRLSHQLTLGWDLKDFDEFVAQAGAPPLSTPITYQPLSFDWAASYLSRRSSTQASLGAVLLLRSLAEQSEFADKRFRAESNFFVLRWDLQRTQALGKDYSLYLRFDGQYSGEPLVSNEQFFAGGAQSVRGYLESEALGDVGLHGTLELRSTSLHALAGADWLREARGFAFLDGARVTLRQPLPGQVGRTTLASGGLGLRLRAARGLEGQLTFAWPFRGTANTPEEELRTLFSIAWRF
jgi:hemolysin activation/secretion protein